MRKKSDNCYKIIHDESWAEKIEFCKCFKEDVKNLAFIIICNSQDFLSNFRESIVATVSPCHKTSNYSIFLLKKKVFLRPLFPDPNYGKTTNREGACALSRD